MAVQLWGPGVVASEHSSHSVGTVDSLVVLASDVGA